MRKRFKILGLKFGFGHTIFAAGNMYIGRYAISFTPYAKKSALMDAKAGIHGIKSKKIGPVVVSSTAKVEKLVEYPYTLGGTIAMLDMCFDELIVSAMKFYLYHSYVDASGHGEDHVNKIKDLIKRLSEPEPSVSKTSEEELGMKEWNEALMAERPVVNGAVRIPDFPDSTKSYFDRQRKAEEAWRERIKQARREFLEVLDYVGE